MTHYDEYHAFRRAVLELTIGERASYGSAVVERPKQKWRLTLGRMVTEYSAGKLDALLAAVEQTKDEAA